MLTNREREIIEHLMKGEKYSAIAADLNISYDTVRFHVKKIRIKSDKPTTLQAVLFFVSSTTGRDSYLQRQLTLW